MTTLRRLLVVQLLMLWQGGFLFYAAVVVPAGTAALGSAAAQGMITARVTDSLNRIGMIGLSVFAFDQARTRDPSYRRTAARWWCWGIAFLCLFLQFVFHQLLDAFMDPERTRVVIRPPFYPVHRMFLWASTIQWLACMVLAGLALLAWRAEDRANPDR